MEKELIPYEQALALKELGFNEPCFGFWSSKNNYRRFINDSSTNIDLKNMFGDESKKAPTAPLYQQAFRFFREKYGLFAEITLWGDGLGYISIIKEIKQEEFIEVYKKDIVDTGLPIWEYEESESVCLKKLIEIVKEKK